MKLKKLLGIHPWWNLLFGKVSVCTPYACICTKEKINVSFFLVIFREFSPSHGAYFGIYLISSNVVIHFVFNDGVIFALHLNFHLLLALHPLSASLAKWSNTFKQFVGSNWWFIWVCFTILWGWCWKGFKSQTQSAKVRYKYIVFCKCLWSVIAPKMQIR